MLLDMNTISVSSLQQGDENVPRIIVISLQMAA